MKLFVRCLVIIVGLALTTAGSLIIVKDYQNKHTFTVKTKATISSVIVDNDEKRKTYYPVIKFNANKKVIEKKFNIGTIDKSKYTKGDKVTVLYSSKNPNNFILKRGRFAYFYGGLFIFIGLITIIGAITKKHTSETLVDVADALMYIAP